MSQLYLVPTPIGNLKDMTFRAVEVLKDVDLILAEDTRTTGKLLKHYEIQTRLQSYHKFNEHQQLQYYIDILLSGQTVALVSDAGTPAISDPGFLLVRSALQNEIKVETLPGATALIPAVVNSGLPNDRFVFEGFLPPKKGRQKRLKALLEEERTIVFYESPYRLVKTLEQFVDLFGAERQVSVSRELTKLYEENYRGTLQEVLEHFKAKKIKGEIVIVLQGQKK
jgi:16S rRNA (cytidine1402-2'-O)-methyltransferase